MWAGFPMHIVWIDRSRRVREPFYALTVRSEIEAVRRANQVEITEVKPRRLSTTNSLAVTSVTPPRIACKTSTRTTLALSSHRHLVIRQLSVAQSRRTEQFRIRRLGRPLLRAVPKHMILGTRVQARDEIHDRAYVSIRSFIQSRNGALCSPCCFIV